MYITMVHMYTYTYVHVHHHGPHVHIRTYVHVYHHGPHVCRLPPSSESKLQLLYKRSVRSSSNPFKRAVYCLLARCEVADNHPDVCSKTEDYMWLKVCTLYVHVCIIMFTCVCTYVHVYT